MSPIRLFAYLVSRVASHGAAHVLVPLGIAVVAVIAALAGVLYHDLPESAVAGSRAGDTPASDTVVVWGPRRFVGAEPGRVGVEAIALTVVSTRRYTLRVRNGAPDGVGRVTGGEVVFNNWQVVSSDDFGPGGYEWSRVVQPRGADTLFLNVAGPGGSYVTVELLESADASFVVFGVERFTAAMSGTVTRTFNISPTAAAPYRLCLANGDADGTKRVADVGIRLNGVEVVSRAQGFSAGVASLVRDVPLMQGANTLEVTLPTRQPAGFLDLCVTATDVTPPVFSIDAPGHGVVTRDTVITVSGIVNDQTPTAVTVNGVTAQRTGDAYSAVVPLAAEGNNVLTISAVDGAGLRTDSIRAVTRDQEAPILTVTAPADGQVTNQNTAGLAGSVSDRTAVTVSANGVPVPVDSAGGFVASVPLALGASLVTVTASDAAGNQAVVVRSIRRDEGLSDVAMASGAAGFSCLDQGGPLVTLSGVQTQRYHNVTLADSTKIDARTAQWIDVAETQTMFATRIGGGVNLCWSGGELIDSFPPATSWFTMLNRYGHRVKPSSATDLEDMRIFNYGYGVLEDSAASNWTVRRTLVRYSRATCVNNPFYHSGTIEDSFLDGCWRGVGSKESSTLGDSSANLVVIRNSLIRLQAIDGSYFSNVPNQSAFWEWTVKGPRISLINNVFRADAHSREGQGNRMYMAPPPGKLAECSGNIMVWLGKGPFPETLPACFTLTTNVAVWDSAVAAWNATYPPVLPDASAPIVSMFQPKIVGDTILTGTVRLIATAVDDRSVAGVQLQLDGQDIGPEQTSPTPYIGADSLLNRDFTTKYQIMWNSASVPNGTHTLRARARDAAGHSTTSAAVSVTVSNAGGLPPDPATVATATDPTVSTNMATSTAFLYTGPNPIQTGVQPGTIQPVRAAVLRGRVLTRDLQPLSGVTITILGHPEFGQTLSRADGMFDMAVNGGGQLIVSYVKSGFLPAQRPLQVPWQDFAVLDDAVMVQLDQAVTEIRFVQPIEVARGTLVNDADGSRRATLLFAQGTLATMVRPSGSTDTLTTLHVRATEYTVGPAGPAAMPAPLPPTSLYTYAVELSVDEALAAGAMEVRFTQPVAIHVENFLGFPVGGRVPVGYYDRARSVWVASPDGRVIRILSATGGLADLDVDGTGQPASSATLAAMGISDAERSTLASLYSAGTSLWRAAMTHFSPVDFNWPPDLRTSIPKERKRVGPPRLDDDCNDKGSVISCEDQTLGEEITVTGTSFALRYNSDRVPGRRPFIDIPLTNDTVGTDLKHVIVKIQVAGRLFVDTFPPLANQRTRFVWDGLDAYGRRVSGSAAANVNVGYVIRPFYVTPEGIAPAFGATADSLRQVILARFDATNWVPDVVVLHTGQDWAGLGGWVPTIHHQYNASGRVLNFGFGDTRSVDAMSAPITTAIGNGVADSTGDGGPANLARLSSPAFAKVAPDGSIYLADQGNHRIRRVSPAGVISTVAGTGSQCADPTTACGDGGAATAAQLALPTGFDFGPDGSLLIADQANHRIRRVDTLGMISTIAGTGETGFEGDGGAATAAKLGNPLTVVAAMDGSVYITDNRRIRKISTDGNIRTVAGNGAFFPCSPPTDPCGDGGPAVAAALGVFFGLAVASDGSLYIAERVRNKVRRVTPDGIIHTFAGTGDACPSSSCGDGGPAEQALLDQPWGISMGADGAMYIAELSSQTIRRVGPDGRITTVAGTRDQYCFPTTASCGDGGPATAARLGDPSVAAITPDGRSLYIVELDNHRVRLVQPALPGFSSTDLAVAAPDGGMLYQFDASGRHLRTVETYTGATLARFSYDSVGRLLSIFDRDSLETRIERAASGDPLAVVAPFGQRTTLTLDTNGYVSGVTNPAGEVIRPRHAANGLLDSLVDARQNRTRFVYDSLGNLIRDEDAIGGFKTLERTGSDSAFEVSVMTALGRRTTYHVEQRADLIRRVVTRSNGLQTQSVTRTNGTATVLTPDGTSISLATAANPRFGMQAPTLRSLSVQLPSGLTSTATALRTASLSNPSDPLSLVSEADSVSINGNWTVTTYAAATRRLVRTSPEGRQAFATFDAKGRATTVQVAGFDSMRLSYDAPGRLRERQVGGRLWTYSYDARDRLLSTLDPLGHRDSLFYDDADQLIRRVLPNGRAVLFAYDGNGNLTSLSPSGGPAHGFQYTAVDLAQQYDPPGIPSPTPTRYFYNLDRQLDSIVRPDSIVIRFGYDAAGRASSVTFDRGTLTFGYSPISGSLIAMRAPSGDSLTFSSDGSLPTLVRWGGAVQGSVGFSYNNDFRVFSQMVNGADAVSFGYDRDGLLTSAGALRLGRSPTNGLLVADTLGPVRSTYQHNAHGELRGYRVTNGGSTLFGAGYARDSLGRIVQLFDTTQGVPTRWSFEYDSVGRLARDSVNGVVFHAFTYDPNGNRLSITSLNGTVNYSYDNQDRLLAAGTTSYTYGSNGELKTKTVPGLGTTTYTYDALGNLVTVLLPAGTRIDYVIDGQNRRIGRKVNGVLVKGWLYQNQLNPVAEIDGGGPVVSRFVYGSRANVPDYMIKSGVTYRLIADHLGSVRLVVDTATGAVAQRLDYDEWGSISQNTNPGFQPFGFAGGLSDDETGLVRFGARDYDPAVGRWTASDPIGFAGGSANLYSYVDSDPVSRSDPSGLDFWITWHSVLLGQNHALIWWQPGGTPDPTTPHVTFGAGFGQCATDGFCLNAEFNRPTDQSNPKGGWMKLALPCGVTELDMLERLANLQAFFMENWNYRLRYAVLPVMPLSYNSNSFARGLANAAGFSTPASVPHAPGWGHPVERRFFGP